MYILSYRYNIFLCDINFIFHIFTNMTQEPRGVLLQNNISNIYIFWSVSSPLFVYGDANNVNNNDNDASHLSE